jgi:hypothetical protein
MMMGGSIAIGPIGKGVGSGMGVTGMTMPMQLK